ncbi:MAG: Txe/YoeB family addiction module toxin [Ginsengibacter sp.]
MKCISLSPGALKQLEDWKKNDPEVVLKIITPITEISSPFTGTGKPELLIHDLKGKWSSRITREHRLVYEVTDTAINIISCKFHY